MKAIFLDFEQPIAELENKIEQLRFVHNDSAVDISDEIDRLQQKSLALAKEIYAKLTPWQICQVIPAGSVRQRSWRAIRSGLTPWITSSTCLPIFRNCTETVPLQMTRPLSVGWRVSKARA